MPQDDPGGQAPDDLQSLLEQEREAGYGVEQEAPTGFHMPTWGWYALAGLALAIVFYFVYKAQTSPASSTTTPAPAKNSTAQPVTENIYLLMEGTGQSTSTTAPPPTTTPGAAPTPSPVVRSTPVAPAAPVSQAPSNVTVLPGGKPGVSGSSNIVVTRAPTTRNPKPVPTHLNLQTNPTTGQTGINLHLSSLRPSIPSSVAKTKAPAPTHLNLQRNPSTGQTGVNMRFSGFRPPNRTPKPSRSPSIRRSKKIAPRMGAGGDSFVP